MITIAPSPGAAPKAGSLASTVASLVKERRTTSSKIVAFMVAGVALLGALTFWGEESAMQSALADYGTEQAMIARAAAGSVRPSLDDHPERTDADATLRRVATRLRALDQPDNVAVLLRPPGSVGFITLDGSKVSSAPIEARFAEGSADGAWVRLSHEESQALGLPPRTAIAGISAFDPDGHGTWGLVLVASAHRERDREERALWRVALSFLLASGVVVTFGTLALRLQRRESESVQRLAVAEAVHARDERLVRADKLATLGTLAAGIAHQVATPLGVIVGRAERLAPRVEQDEKASRAVAVIAEQAERINQIVRGFLVLARGGTPSLEHVKPEDLARATIELVSHRFEKASVALELKVEGRPSQVACDPHLFEQVLVNLLLNGCDACQAGGRVLLTVQGREQSVAFLVDDDGPGISEDAAVRSTEPFFTTKAPGEGTGLGLAIAREIVAHHRGTLQVTPLPGRGTQARVEVPAISESRDA